MSLSISPQEAGIRAALLVSRKNLIAFTLTTKRDYEVSPHHELVASYLMRVERGEIDRLMLCLPPRQGKSELATRRLPAWYLGRYPKRMVISASYNMDKAADFGRDVRNIVASPIYQSIFKVTLAADSKAADRWNTKQGGSYLAAGIGTGITGYGAHLGLIDDPFKDEKEAQSKTVRDNVWNWYKTDFYTRLMPGAAIILTASRRHEDDLGGRLLKAMEQGGDQWTVVRLPAIAEERDPLGRQLGEALWPAWYPLETLERIRGVLSSYDWESLYQQRPTAQEGNIIKRHWWRRYREIPDFSFTVQSWDTGFKTGDLNDYTVCISLGISGNNIYIFDRFKAKLEFPDLKRAVATLGTRHRPNAVLIEDKASGQSLVQELQRDTNLPIIPIKVDRDKVARANAITPMIEGGRVYVPEWATWVDDYLECMAAFPKGADDDDVDATSQGLNYLRSRTEGDTMTAADVRSLIREHCMVAGMD